MANQVFNIALGRAVELYNNVQTNSPANSALILVAISTTATDAVLKDLNTLADILGNANTAEVTNVGYSRIVLTDANLSAFAVDDTNDRVDLDIPDQTLSAVQAGDNWTDILVCYDPDTAAGTDANIVPLTQHDFVITPDGTDITIQVDPAGFYRAS